MAYPLALLVWLRTFEASARHLSFARAAQELGLTPAAVSQQIKALESHLGFALFERLPRGVRLTTVGRAYAPAVRKALDELSVATVGLFGSSGRRSLTIRCSLSFAALCLSPRLGAFRAAHPDIGLKVYSSIWSDDLDDDRIDLDIRYGDGRWDGFDVEPLSAPVSVPVCPPDARFGDDPASDLLPIVARRPIHILGCENLWTDLSRRLGWPEGSIDGGVSVDTSVIALEMVSAGIGSAMISRDLTLLHAAAGRVMVPPGIALRHDQRHFLLTPRRGRRPSADVLLLRDWLLRTFRTGPQA